MIEIEDDLDEKEESPWFGGFDISWYHSLYRVEMLMENEDGCCWFIAKVTIFTPFTSFVPIKDMKKVQKNSLATCVADYRI